MSKERAGSKAGFDIYFEC